MVVYMNEKSKRCIDAVLKRCESCPYGVIDYPDWVETYDDLIVCCYDTICMYGYENDIPTLEEVKAFVDFIERIRNNG